MHFRSLAAMLVVGSLVFTVGSNDAWAKKKKSDDSAETVLVEIAETGTSADSVFMEAKGIHDTLNEIQTKLTEGNAELVSALGLTEGTPLADAVADLKAKAGDKLTIAMDGTMPTVTVADGVPDNVSAAVTSLNSFVKYHGEAISSAQGLVEQAQAVVAKAQGLDPAALAQEVASNPMDIPKVVKTVKSNITAVTQTPKRIEDTVGALTANIETIKGLAN